MRLLQQSMADGHEGLADTNDIRYAMVGRDTSDIHALATADVSPGFESGEANMLTQLLKETGKQLCKYCHARSYKGKLLYREAREWALSDDTDSPFSFVNVCEALGIDPEYARKEWRPYLCPTTQRRRGRVIRIYPLNVVRV